MEVQAFRPSGCSMVFLGILTLGIAPLVIVLQMRNWPAYLDEEGLVTRGGKCIRWDEFSRIVRVVTRIASGVTVERYELYSPQGKVLVLPDRLVDGERVMQYILDHLPESAFDA